MPRARYPFEALLNSRMLTFGSSGQSFTSVVPGSLAVRARRRTTSQSMRCQSLVSGSSARYSKRRGPRSLNKRCRK